MKKLWSFEFEGKNYDVVAEPVLDNYKDNAAWFGEAVDVAGNNYKVIWEHIEGNVDEDHSNDCGDCADWDHPIEVVIM